MDKDLCIIHECDRNQLARRLCKKHYYAARRRGEIESFSKLPPAPKKLCSVDGCPKARHAHGLCPTHLKRMQTHGTTDPVTAKGMTVDQAFLFYQGPATEGGCIEWTGYIMPTGYGRIGVGGQRVSAHRYAYERANGPIPDGMLIRHTCDNPPCVNPQHLLTGRHADNVADAVSRNRQNRGEAVNTAKLTEGQVREIRKSGLPTKVLSARYGVSDTTVVRIRSRKVWAWLAD